MEFEASILALRLVKGLATRISQAKRGGFNRSLTKGLSKLVERGRIGSLPTLVIATKFGYSV